VLRRSAAFAVNRGSTPVAHAPGSDGKKPRADPLALISPAPFAYLLRVAPGTGDPLMRSRTLPLAILALALLAVGAQPPGAEFLPFASATGRYKTIFPGGVKTETTEIKTDAGPRTLTFDTVVLAGDVRFMVTYVDPPEDVTKLPPGPRLDRVRDAVKGTDGKLVSEKDVVVGAEKHPGREVLIEKPFYAVRNRVVLAGPRLYQVLVQGPKEVVTSRDADRFLDAFEITK
jgi:hypothetical protein